MTKKKTEYICKGCGIAYPAHTRQYHYCTIECHFWSKTDKTGECWEWTAGGHKFGYGEFRVAGKLIRAHRYSYEIHKGEIPAGFGINHTCDNPKCVNPDHLYAGTQRDNLNDALSRSRHSNRLLNKDQVLEIRGLLSSGKLNPHQISRAYNVYPSTIYDIRDGKTWTHV